MSANEVRHEFSAGYNELVNEVFRLFLNIVVPEKLCYTET